MTPAPSFSVAIVTYNSAQDIGECLEAVKALVPPPQEIVVADCGSLDESAEIARQASVGDNPVTVLPLGKNRGFAGGMNVALERCTARWVVTLNPDVRLTKDYVSRLLLRVNAHPQLQVGAVTGRLLRWQGAEETPVLDAAGMKLTLSWRHLDRGSGEADRGQLSVPCRVFGATGAATVWRRDALDDVAIEGESFDSLFHSFREDAELCFRLQERGWEVLYEPTAQAQHRRWVLPERRSSLPDAVNRGSLRNRYLLRLYHQTVPNLVWSLIPCLTRDLLALAWVLLRERSSLPAYSWLWRKRREIRRRARLIRARRTRPWWELDRWFFNDSVPLPGSDD